MSACRGRYCGNLTDDAHYVVDLGWSSKRNGELLKLMLTQGLRPCSRSIRISRFNRTCRPLVSAAAGWGVVEGSRILREYQQQAAA